MHFSGLEKCIWAWLCLFRLGVGAWHKAEILLNEIWAVVCFSL